MNKVNLMGRICADPETRYTTGNNQMCIARYRLAVNRPKDKDGNQQADFISCVAFGKRGEFAEKWLKKGMMIAICGHIQTGSYEGNDGKKVYTTDVIVDEHYFCGSSNNSTGTQSNRNDFAPTNEAAPGQWTSPTYSGQQKSMTDYSDIADEIEGDDDLPF